MSASESEVRLSREMRLLDVTMIGVGAMIGAGIFVLTGIAAGTAGPALLVAFLLNGVVTVFTAMAYAELGSCFHDAGGGYLWAKKGLPGPNGFLSGWMSWFAHSVACSLYALGFGAYFALLLKMLGYTGGHDWPIPLEKLLAAGIVILFGWINYRGASETGKAGNAITAAKIAILAVFVGFGISVMLRRPNWTANFEDFLPQGWGGVFMAMGLTFIAFEGYEIIAQCSEEVEDPRRNIPRAVFISLAVVVPIYLLVAWVALGAIDGGGIPTWKYLAEKKELAMVEAARQFFTGGGVMILVGGLLSTMSALNATVFSSSRVSFAMGRDHNLPASFGRLSNRHRTPHVALIYSLVIIIAMLLWLPIEDVASAADIMFLMLFLQVNVALITLRRKMPDLDRGFRVPLVPLVPILGILGNLFIAGWLFRFSPMAWLAAAVWVAGGVLLHRFYAGPREEAEEIRVEQIARLERKDYRVLVALSSPRTTPSLIEVGVALARRHGGEIVCLSVVEVAENQPLVAGLEETERVRPLLDDAVRHAAAAGLGVRAIIKVSHRISHGIVETAREEDCNFIVVGRHRRPAFLHRVFGAALDGVLQNAPCDVAVVGGLVKRGVVRRVLVAVGDDRSASLAAELSPAFADWCEADVRPVTVIPSLATAQEAQVQRERAEELLEASHIQERLAVVRAENVADAIESQADAGNLVLMGGGATGALAQLLSPPAPLELMDRGQVSVVMVRKHGERPAGRLERLFSPR